MDSVTDQVIAQGPVALQEAIKMLGTNGLRFSMPTLSSFRVPRRSVILDAFHLCDSGGVLHAGPYDRFAAPWLGCLGGDGDLVYSWSG